ncbi:M14 family zinc carboxypeptidase [Mesoflavibacter zeaxanthinifaciens]|uniref:M14 family zinc carboxypeptidase n=1 Tax=Mesoflavibacter zeaxanthinifaciens TaxID=393060 RepID=UPI0004095DC4|nr:M14 family zinc carboxypeptidase [Mesoflavibacter zeaxanthinifaciens]
MKKTNLLVTLILLLLSQLIIAQDSHKRISITNPSKSTLLKIATSGIDLNCGANHSHDNLVLDLSKEEVNALVNKNVSFNVIIDDLEEFYRKRAVKTKAKAIAQLNAEKSLSATNTNTTQRASISNTVQDNIIQYINCDEINWVTPQNFHLGSMGGCLTVDEMKTELDEMRSFSITNGLDIVSQKLDASPTGQTTWGNPSNTIFNNGLTYSGIGNSRWNPETIYYVRITGNESSTPENTKPQILFTSMIHSREVSALMNNIFFMWYLIENYNTNDAIKELVDNNELYFVPIVNPDGLRWNEHLSPNGGGMQRKNTRPNTGSNSSSTSIRGVDLNRNFDYYWGYNNVGSSGSQTSNTYRGPSPSSEPETQIMEDFILSKNFQTAVWNHSYANSVPHPYGGVPSLNSGREDEFYSWHEEMTRYNRYLYGATIFYESNGIPDDWMLGGAPDNNGSTGSGQAILGTTPEHGSEGFWPPQTSIIPIAKRSMRISFGTAYYGGKYAKLHDLTQSNIDDTTANLDFGIERIGQTASNFTLTITPISSNIISINAPATQTGMNVLEQRNVSAQIQLDPSIVANEKIEYNVKLSNDNGVIYDVNYEKYYQPTVLFDHDPDVDGITGWTQSGGWTLSSADTYTGTNTLRTNGVAPYSNNTTRTLTTTNSYDFSNSTSVVVQYYSKWDIERNYDFVEILGSTDGGNNWQSLCGKYTKPNATSNTTTHDNKGGSSNFQANSMGQVYDGDRRDNWVMEEIAIDAANNSYLLGANNVKFRFRFRTDGSNVSENYTTTSDGFFIDDFKIISIQLPCTETTPTGLTIDNTTVFSAEVSWDIIPSATYDIRYKALSSSTWTVVNNINTNYYTISGLNASSDYEVQVATRCNTTTSPYSSSVYFTTNNIVPCTGDSIATFPYIESFEADFGFWTQAANGTEDDIDWTRNSGSTTSTATGPNFASNGSTYIYTEASSNVTPAGNPNKVTYLISPCFDLTNYINTELTFDYHMYGSDIGTLKLQVSLDNGGSYSDLFSISDQQQSSNGASWNTETVDLSTYDGQVIKLRLFGLTGTSFNGDIAVDNINITAQENEPLSTQDFTSQNIKIYPNPFNNSFNISLSSNFIGHKIEVSVYDMRGRLIIQENSVFDQKAISVDNLKSISNGTYFIKIKDLENQQLITKKLIKQ